MPRRRCNRSAPVSSTRSTTPARSRPLAESLPMRTNRRRATTRRRTVAVRPRRRAAAVGGSARTGRRRQRVDRAIASMRPQERRDRGEARGATGRRGCTARRTRSCCPRPRHHPGRRSVDHRARGRGRRQRRAQLLVRGRQRREPGLRGRSSPGHRPAAHAIALPSCTAGLHLSLLALGVGPGDEVIVPGDDVDRHGRTDHVRRRDAGLRRRRARHVVHVGRVAASAASRRGRRRSSPSTSTAASPTSWRSRRCAPSTGSSLIEDAAEAAGGRHAGRAAGSFGATSTFSFHGSKTLTTGEGGMVLSDDEDLHRADGVPPRPRPAPRRRVVPQRRGGVEVQDERAAGGARACPARPHRRAHRRRSARSSAGTPSGSPARASRSTSSGPASGRRTGWSPPSSTPTPGITADTVRDALADVGDRHPSVLPAAQRPPGLRGVARHRARPGRRTRRATTWPAGPSTCRRR